jgi:hypothetical protein
VPELKFKSPCNDCPFRRGSAAGWLGSGTPESFVNGATADYDPSGELPCHQTIDYSDPEWRETQLPEAAACVGALQFCENNMKTPRDPERAAIRAEVGTNPDVFDWAREFIDYHRGAEWQSWEDDGDPPEIFTA